MTLDVAMQVQSRENCILGTEPLFLPLWPQDHEGYEVDDLVNSVKVPRDWDLGSLCFLSVLSRPSVFKERIVGF